MKKFTSVTILGVKFAVKWRPQRVVASLTPESPYTIGLCDGLDDEIHVASDLKLLNTQRRIFAHEWTHGVCEVNGVNQTLDNAMAEVQAQSGANALVELFKQVDVIDFLIPENIKKKLLSRWQSKTRQKRKASKG